MYFTYPVIVSDLTPKRGGLRRTPQSQRATPQRSQRETKQNPGDGFDISYLGANKSCQFLQQSISHPGPTSSAGRCQF